MSELSAQARTIAEGFLKNEYRDYIGYSELLKIEKNEQFKEVLTELIEHEREDVAFWEEVLGVQATKVNRIQIWAWKMMRRTLGLTFTAKYLERGERKAAAKYESIKTEFGPERQARIEEMIEHEKGHEQEMINQLQEKKVEFLSNIVLGLNDGLIELSGALVGFTFALRETTVAGASGLITGIAASLSMASSAYLQAKHEEEGKDPVQAALYTGGSYAVVVALLIAPYFLFSASTTALVVMGIIVLGIIAGMSGYSAVLFGRTFKSQFSEMALFSIGTAIVAFLLGSVVDWYIL